MKVNERMKHMIDGCDPKRSSLSSALLAVLNEGLAYIDGCVLLKSQLRLTNSNIRKEFQDETGYECFVNHFHLEDILASNDVCFLLEQALAFSDELLALKSTLGISDPVEYIISGDEDGISVRFHVLRPNQHWLANDLEGYEEAVAAIRLTNK